ncbi:glycosyltransferase family 4 protein [Altererythrobacter sp. TH136]|nr:glycosyltransferase family 4 protein [Altererythrobacter sp. TH136]
MNAAFALNNFRGPLIADLVSTGATVYGLAPDFDHYERERLRAIGGTPVDYGLHRTGLNPVRETINFIRLIGILRGLRVDTVLACFIKPAIYGTLAANIVRVPCRQAMIEGLGYAFTDADGASWKRQTLQRIVSFLLSRSIKFAHTVYFLNDEDQQLFIDKRLVRSDTAVRLDGIGVDLDQFRFAPPVSDPVTFLMVARALREKGIYEFIGAAKEIKQDWPTARFVLAGGLDSNPGAVARDQLEQWEREGILTWRGHVDDVSEELKRASVFVLPSWREGSPRSTQEAMAMGRPVITTAAPGAKDTVVEGVNGYLVPVRDPSALASAMRRFLNNPSQIASMGVASRALAESRYDVRQINARILSRMGFH